MAINNIKVDNDSYLKILNMSFNQNLQDEDLNLI